MFEEGKLTLKKKNIIVETTGICDNILELTKNKLAGIFF